MAQMPPMSTHKARWQNMPGSRNTAPDESASESVAGRLRRPYIFLPCLSADTRDILVLHFRHILSDFS